MHDFCIHITICLLYMLNRPRTDAYELNEMAANVHYYTGVVLTSTALT